MIEALRSPRRYIETPIGKEIQSGIAFARDFRQPSLVVGAAGIGKTMTIRHMAERKPERDVIHGDSRPRMLVATPANSKMKSFLASVADVFDFHTSREHCADIERTLWARLPEKVEAGAYLIIDEAQNLDLDTFRTALFLFDQAELPIAFVGNPSVLKRVQGKTAAFEQISDRIAHRVELKPIGRADVEAFGVCADVEGRESYELLVRFGIGQSLRQVATLLNHARTVAGANGPIRHSHLVEAVSLLRGPEAARKLIKEERVK